MCGDVHVRFGGRATKAKKTTPSLEHEVGAYVGRELPADDRAVVGVDDSASGIRSASPERVEEVQLVHHSDAGSQYGSFDYSQTLDDHRVLASVGSVGDAYDCEQNRERCSLSV